MKTFNKKESAFPEHAKLYARKEEYQAICSFLEWMYKQTEYCVYFAAYDMLGVPANWTPSTTRQL